ncbi:predicted protein [Naegleria gruberi]|uniref:Predicted protein n=1 Tax=Naegleria gruberi TaxID=5762 RepID=D2VEB2_NAEGR|nr:uncharacterized protein NAEGRDRAFT_48855 [Naegleria gruberi]EFC44850.1 predicted protein [Naegleria gruberi]|eukprot:XP_002677594.1 predicted protein [Naegleria gruberi strain NEG-M]
MPFIVFLSKCVAAINEGMMIPRYEFKFYKCKPSFNIENDKIFQMSKWILCDCINVTKRNNSKDVEIGNLNYFADYSMVWHQECDDEGYSNHLGLKFSSADQLFTGRNKKNRSEYILIQKLEEGFYHNENCTELVGIPNDDTSYEHNLVRNVICLSYNQFEVAPSNGNQMKGAKNFIHWIRELVLTCHECGILHNQYLLQMMLNFLFRINYYVHDLHRITFYDNIAECCPYNLNTLEILDEFNENTKAKWNEDPNITSYTTFMKVERSFNSQLLGDAIDSYIISLIVNPNNMENPFEVVLYQFYEYHASVCFSD